MAGLFFLSAGLVFLGLTLAILCDCCEVCTIFGDDFEEDVIATSWTTQSGTWSVVGGYLTTSSPLAILTPIIPVTAGLTGMQVSVDVRPTQGSSRLIIQYTGTLDHWFSELTPGSPDGTLKIWERTGGVDTQRGPTVIVTGYTGDATASFYLCYGLGRVTVSVGLGSFVATGFSVNLTVAGSIVGVGTGTGTDLRTFDNFRLQRHHADDLACPACPNPCGGVICDIMPQETTLTVTGAVNGTCINCSVVNGTWIFRNNWSNTGVSSGGGAYEGCFTSAMFVAMCFPSGDGMVFDASIIVIPPPDINPGQFVEITFGQWPGHSVIWRHPITPSTCNNFGPMSMPLISHIVFGCDFSGATMTVTLR